MDHDDRDIFHFLGIILRWLNKKEQDWQLSSEERLMSVGL
jgi:hypothetical protein